MKILCTLFCLLFSASVAHAQKGNEVLDRCQEAIRFIDHVDNTKSSFESGWCLGWMNSTIGLTVMNQEWRRTITKATPGQFDFCIPEDGIPPIQGIRMLVKYLTAHPEKLHTDGMLLTMAALKEAFPCKD